jgi:hypothetical protein
MRRIYTAILFIIILICISFFYHYNEIAFKRPQSVHKWRQSDCASIALNYYQGGMRFFNSETHNLTSDSGTTGKCCTSEIPILYYVVASFYKVFGYHEYIYRIFNTLLFLLGLFFLFQFIQFLLKDSFWAIALTILFFTSPVLVYYGNNFLPNSSSLAFSIMGWYFFVRFSFERKPKWFYISIIIFFIAAALKVTALFSIFAILGIYLLELFKLKKFNEGRILFNQPVKYLLSIIFILFIIGLWVVYAHSYNQRHDSSYFSTTIFPLWNLNRTEIKAILDNINNLWLDQYFHKSVLLFLSVCFLFIMVFFRKNNALLIFSITFIFAEVIVYIILQFWTFADHDYYTINMYILPILIVVSSFDILKRHFSKVFSSAIFKVVFSLFLLFNIYYAHQKINERYEGWMNDYQKNNDLYTITPYLRQIGISSSDTVISIPDKSNISLYLMNQKGWTEYTDAKFNREIHVLYNQDSIGIKTSIEKGAKYLIVNGISELYEKEYLQSYCSSLRGNYGGVLIFDLRNTERNFNLKKRTIDAIVKCNAELISADKQFFISEIDSILFQFGRTRSDKYAHNGKYSSKINASSPYGMTIKFGKLKNGESFKILVWRKADDKLKGGLIASSSPNLYYNNEYKVLQTDSNGWDHICMEFFVTSELTNQELVIYVYNPDPDPVYFDDLEIIRYKSVFSSLKL